MEGDSPVTPMEEPSPTRAPTTDVPPAIDCASQRVTPVTPDSTPPELTDTAPAQATLSVPTAVADASLDFKEEEAGHAAKVHAAGAVQGKGSEARPSATITETEPRATAEGKAAPNSPSAPSEANAEPSTHAAEGFTDNRAAADSPDVRAKAKPSAPMTKIKAKATPNGPAAEFSATETIAAKHAVGSASTVPKKSAASSSAQAKSERQAAKIKAAAQGKSGRQAAKSKAAAQAKSERKAAKSKAAAQTASSAAAAAASPPIALGDSDIKSVRALKECACCSLKLLYSTVTVLSVHLVGIVSAEPGPVALFPSKSKVAHRRGP
ncbi:TPA: hypothetical protein ACH3X3_000488 [Trebouxia sp. C0006]